MADRTILLDGWSKTFAMTGWRLGFGVFPPALVEPITRLAINSVSCTSAFSQYAAIAPRISAASASHNRARPRSSICSPARGRTRQAS